MKVAILAPFNSYDEAYSLCGVVKNQIEMLTNNGIDVVLLVNKGFVADGVFAKVKIFELPYVFTENQLKHIPIKSKFDKDIEIIYEKLKEALDGVSVCITHDIIFQNAYIIHHIAARKVAAENNSIWWLNWVHSASKPMHKDIEAVEKFQLCTAFPNSFIIYPNHGDIKRVSINYNVNENMIKIVPHSIDVYSYFKFDPLAIRICEQCKLLNADIIGIYPVRLDRGKQPHILIEIFAALNRMGKDARLLIIDFHSTGGDKVVYRNEMIKRVNELNLIDKITFTSQMSYIGASVPNYIISSLFNIANVFILASTTETYSLIAQEAALSGNLLILNHDFPPFKSIYGYAPYYFPFSSDINMLTGEDGSTITKINDKIKFFDIIAKNIVHEISTNRVLSLKTNIRRTKNLQAVYNEYLDPLLGSCVYKLCGGTNELCFSYIIK